MRRASICLALAGATAALAVPSFASAAPTVTFKAEAVPISGVPNTGNKYGAGAAFKSTFKIEGNEYAGHQPPLIGVKVQFPKGVTIVNKGWATCPTATLTEEKEPSKCPAKSKAGPKGSAKGFVYFGSTEVQEEVSVESFFSSSGGINFFVEGHSPALIELTSVGSFASLKSSPGGYGPQFNTKVPLIETVPGANDGSTEEIHVTVGAARKAGKKWIYYGTVPKKGSCPKGGYPVKATLEFANTEVLPTVEVGSTVVATAKAPCPRS